MNRDLLRILKNEGITRLTGNTGFDTARARLAEKVKSTGYSVEACRDYLMKHPTIKVLRDNKACKILTIYGDNLIILCKDELAKNYLNNIKHVNSHVTIVSVVNNILNNYLSSSYGLVTYGKTQFWKSYEKNKVYKKYIHVGADIINLKGLQMFNNDYNATLSLRKKETYYK